MAKIKTMRFKKAVLVSLRAYENTRIEYELEAKLDEADDLDDVREGMEEYVNGCLLEKVLEAKGISDGSRKRAVKEIKNAFDRRAEEVRKEYNL